eukprot:TRINITY_DN7791_c0_g1_i2.p1 TRINITY_DN7791_c0_g1~~TRINITY_DN7791_c0_g1_i2.p1  ORF type:complete len:1598 (+),score=403.75 TRINITY_DN7791_c0_g1_i2:83-4876(+)
MELISMCVVLLTGIFLGRVLPRCRSGPTVSNEQAAIAAASAAQEAKGRKRTPEEKRQALRQAKEAGALPRRIYEGLLERIDRGELHTQLSGAIGTDSVECPWLQEAVQELWPSIDKYVGEDILTDLLEPLLQDCLGMTVKFTKKTLGSEVPRVGPLRSRVTRDSRGSGVELCVGLRYISNCDIELQLGVLRVGVSNLSVVGTAMIYLRPLVSGPLFLGGIEIAFLNPPEMELDFHGIGRAVDIPGLRDIVLQQIVSVIGMVMVLPNRIAVGIDDRPGSVYGPLMMCPEPSGYLRITFLRANDLLASDVAVFGQATSDPYVWVVLGSDHRQTPYIPKSLNPVWVRDNVFDFPVHSAEQVVDIEVWDYDHMKPDDLLGHYRGHSVAKLLQGGSTEQTVELEDGTGTLTFSVQWLDALGRGQSVDNDGKRVVQSGPGKGHDSTTGHRHAECVEGDRTGLELTEGAVLLMAWFGSDALGSQWVDVLEAVCDQLASGGKVLADAAALGCQRPRGGPHRLHVEYIIPEGPNVGVITICLERLDGLKVGDYSYRCKVEVTAESWEDPKVFESGVGGPPPGTDEVLAARLEEEILQREGEGRELAEIAQAADLDAAVVRALLDPADGMRVRYARLQKRIEMGANTLSVAENDVLHKEADAIRRQWQARACESWRARRSAAEPRFDFAAHVPVPADWEAVTVTLLDKSSSVVAGLRFPSQRCGGCLGLGRVIAGSKGGTGAFEALDKELTCVDVRCMRVRPKIEGPFLLPVPPELVSTNMSSSLLGSTQAAGARLHAKLQMHALVPREPVSYQSAVIVEVIGARNLVAMDVATGASDPYVKVRYRDMQYHTNAISRTVNPVWQQRFEFPAESALDYLDFECWDWEMSGYERFMGRCNVNPFTFVRKAAEREAREREARGWYVDASAPPAREGTGTKRLAPRLGNDKDWRLMQSKGRTVAMGLGQLQLRITLRGDFPDDIDCLGDDQGRQESVQQPIGGTAAAAAAAAVSDPDSEGEADNSADGEWVRDRDALSCRRCGVKFSTLTRRHHCRRCGQVFCDNCSSHRVSLGPLKNQRTCGSCARSVQAKRTNPLHALLGDELAAIYLDQFIAGGETDASLKAMTPGQLDAYFDRIGVHGKLHRQAIAGRIALSDAGGLPRRSVTVEVLRGQDLIVQDAFFSDPFVVVAYRGIEMRTPVVRRNLNPTWGAKNRWTFPLTSADDEVELLCLDYDREKAPDFLGWAAFRPMSEPFISGEAVAVPLGVRPDNRDDEIVLKSKGHKHEHPLGLLEVRVQVNHGGDLRLIHNAIPGDSVLSASPRGRSTRARTPLGSAAGSEQTRRSRTGRSPTGFTASEHQARSPFIARSPTGGSPGGSDQLGWTVTSISSHQLTREWCDGLYEALTSPTAAGGTPPRRGALLRRLQAGGGELGAARDIPEVRAACARACQELAADPERPMSREEFAALLLGASQRSPSPPLPEQSVTSRSRTAASVPPSSGMDEMWTRQRAATSTHSRSHSPGSPFASAGARISTGSAIGAPPDGAPDWVPDESRSKCTGCSRHFSVVRRKHHCRKCGDVFCRHCCSQWHPVEGYAEPQRVCGQCAPVPSIA